MRVMPLVFCGFFGMVFDKNNALALVMREFLALLKRVFPFNWSYDF